MSDTDQRTNDASPLIDLLLRSLKELAAAERTETACQLAGQALGRSSSRRSERLAEAQRAAASADENGGLLKLRRVTRTKNDARDPH